MRNLLCVLLVICLACPVMYRDAQAEAMSVLQQYPNQVALGLAIAAAGKTAIVAAWNAAMVVLPAAAGMAMLSVIVAMAVANDGITSEEAQTAAKSLRLSKYEDHNLCGDDEFRIVKRTKLGLMFVDNVCWNLWEAVGLAYVGLDIWTSSSIAAFECAAMLGSFERCLVIAGSYEFDCDLRNNMILGENHGEGKYDHFHVVAPSNDPNETRYVNPTENHIFYGKANGGTGWPWPS